MKEVSALVGDPKQRPDTSRSQAPVAARVSHGTR